MYIRSKYKIVNAMALVIEFADVLRPWVPTGYGFIRLPRLAFVNRGSDYFSGPGHASGADTGRIMLQTNKKLQTLTARDLLYLEPFQPSYVGTAAQNSQAHIQTSINTGEAERNRLNKYRGIGKKAGVVLIVVACLVASFFQANNGYGFGVGATDTEETPVERPYVGEEAQTDGGAQ